MQHVFIGRDTELSLVDELYSAKKGGVLAFQGKSGTGKSTLLRNLNNKYFLHPRLFIDCSELPVVETAGDFLFYLSQQNTGLKNLTSAGEIINKKRLAKKSIDDIEQVLFEALIKDCKQIPIIFIDSYEYLLKEAPVFIHRIESEYSHLHYQHTPYKDTLLYTEWITRLLHFFKANGALLIVTGRELEPWLKNRHTLEYFEEDDILSYASMMKLEKAIAEDCITVALILKRLSFGGNPLWLNLACHFLVNELACGKQLADLKKIKTLEEYLSISDREKKAESNHKYNIYKLALFEWVMPPHKEHSWLIVLPQYLDNEIFTCLFGHQGNMFFHTLKSLGLLSKSKVNSKYLKLHDELRSLLLSFANHQNLLHSYESRQIHQKLQTLYEERLIGERKNKLTRMGRLYHQLMTGHNSEVLLKSVTKSRQLISLAITLQNTDEYLIMTPVLFRLLTLVPEHNEAWHSLGVTLSKQGRYDDAIAVFQRQLSLNFEHTAAWKNMGYAFYHQGYLEQTVDAYQKKRNVLNEKENAWKKIILRLSNENNLQNTVKDYQQKISNNPKHETAYYNLGLTFKKLGEFNKAIAAYKKQLKINPKHERAWNNMGTALFEQEKYEEAKDAFNKALKIDETYLFALTNYAELTLIKTDERRSLKLVAKILSLVDDKAEERAIMLFLAWLHDCSKSYEPILEAIQQRQPDNHFNWNFEAIEKGLQKFAPAQQKIAYSFIAYFKQSFNFSTLQSQLRQD